MQLLKAKALRWRRLRLTRTSVPPHVFYRLHLSHGCAANYPNTAGRDVGGPSSGLCVCVQLRRHNQAPKARFAFCSAPYTISSGHFVTISWTRAPGIACTRAFLGPFARRRSRVSSRPDVDVPTLAREPRPGLGHPSCTRLAPSRVRRSPCLTPHWLIDGFA